MHTNDAISPRIVNRIFDESDLVFIGSQILRHTNIARPDGDNLGIAMPTAYSKTRDHQGLTPLPMFATTLGYRAWRNLISSNSGMCIHVMAWWYSFLAGSGVSPCHVVIFHKPQCQLKSRLTPRA